MEDGGLEASKMLLKNSIEIIVVHSYIPYNKISSQFYYKMTVQDMAKGWFLEEILLGVFF